MGAPLMPVRMAALREVTSFCTSSAAPAITEEIKKTAAEADLEIDVEGYDQELGHDLTSPELIARMRENARAGVYIDG